MDFLRLFVLAFSWFFILSPLVSIGVESNPELGNIARIDAAITSKQHYKQHPLDDEISKLVFQEYFKTLDPSKIYFTKKDIKKFENYKDRIDNTLNDGNIDFAFKVYNLFLDKVRKYQKFTDQIIKKGFDFTKDEDFLLDRSKTDWVNDDKELKEIWRKKVKNDILAIKLMKTSKKTDTTKEKDKEKKPKKNVHKSWNKSPEEIVSKRAAQYLTYLEQNEGIDVLELFLSSFKKVYDPHSSYMKPTTEEDFNISMKLSLVGIGALLTTEDGYTKIVKLIPGGPAEKSKKLKPEDRIIAVTQEEGEAVDIIDMPLSKVVRLIRGEKNTDVHLTILDGSQGINAIPKVITITRDEVKLKDQEAKGEILEIESNANKKKHKIGVISLPSFYLDFEGLNNNSKDYKSSTRDVKKIIENFKTKNIDGLILDIRSNGGGSLWEAIKLTGLFIKQGPVVQVKNSAGSIERKVDSDEKIYYDGPLLVMTNVFSASASEIFAGAIQDYRRGIIVGDAHTHGKGTVQTIYALAPFLSFFGSSKPAGSIKLTTAKFYRINGSSTQAKGVEPDIIMPSSSNTMKIGEKHLDYALPWDSIVSAYYDVYDNDLPASLPKLKKLSKQRREQSNEFKELTKLIGSFQKIRDRKYVSLNEKKRWKNYLLEKKVIEKLNKLLKWDDDDDDGQKVGLKKDLYLDESIKIMRDYIDLKKTGEKKTVSEFKDVKK